jgi:hypothetical protein
MARIWHHLAQEQDRLPPQQQQEPPQQQQYEKVDK